MVFLDQPSPLRSYHSIPMIYATGFASNIYPGNETLRLRVNFSNILSWKSQLRGNDFVVKRKSYRYLIVSWLPGNVSKTQNRVLLRDDSDFFGMINSSALSKQSETTISCSSSSPIVSRDNYFIPRTWVHFELGWAQPSHAVVIGYSRYILFVTYDLCVGIFMAVGPWPIKHVSF